MPVIQSSNNKERIPIQPGDHILTLVTVKTYEQDDTFHPNEDGTLPKKTRLIWQFESDKADDDGDAYEYAEWTGPYYGNPKAKLTGFLDQILPGESEGTKERLDTDSVLGRRFKVKIQNQKNAKGDYVPRALYFEPLP